MMRDILKELRAAPPTLSPPDHAAAGDEGGAGEGLPLQDLAAGGNEGGGVEGAEDLLSALPDDVLLLVLLDLPSAAEAARTCVLSRRWRRVWTQLPDLRFPLHAEPAPALPSPVAACAALALHAAPALRLLSIVANDADPRDVAAVLRLAAPRLTRELSFHNVVPEDRKDVVEAEADVALPCFERAEKLMLCLGYLPLLLPPSAVFTKLTVLGVAYVRFADAGDIGDAFSSTHCPLLRQLCLYDTQGVSKLTIRSGSLLGLLLHTVEGLEELTVVAPVLIDLRIFKCFQERQPVVDIVAPSLKMINWVDIYDPSSVQLGELSQLRMLSTFCFAATPQLQEDFGTVMLLQRFCKTPALSITIFYQKEMVYYQYLMETLTLLLVENLWLQLVTFGHAVISCVFHFLKISTRIRSLFLDLHEAIKEQSACSPDCICHQPQDWKTEELCLNSLQELRICGLSGSDDDLAFVKRLLGWTPVLKTVTIVFHPSAIVDEELWMELHDLSRPETAVEILPIS